jgi:hypothetical protein
MSWKYKQSTGQLFDPAGVQVAVGFSGYGENRNKPDLQNVPRVGCIPRGFYTIEDAFKHVKLGPVCMVLTPYETNVMFGRSLFRIHGAAADNPNTPVNETLISSHGCIILKRDIRELINESDDKILEVVE